jgi:hypothetical protein
MSSTHSPNKLVLLGDSLSSHHPSNRLPRQYQPPSLGRRVALDLRFPTQPTPSVTCRPNSWVNTKIRPISLQKFMTQVSYLNSQNHRSRPRSMSGRVITEISLASGWCSAICLNVYVGGETYTQAMISVVKYIRRWRCTYVGGDVDREDRVGGEPNY